MMFDGSKGTGSIINADLSHSLVPIMTSAICNLKLHLNNNSGFISLYLEEKTRVNADWPITDLNDSNS